MKGYISSYTLFILSIYLIIISTYSAQYSIKLKTIHNIQIYYDSIISDKLKRGDEDDSFLFTTYINRLYGYW